MKSNSHGQQRSQDQNKRLCSFGYPALCRIAETDGDSDIGPPATQGWNICWELNTARQHEPNPTPISLVKLKDRCRSWRKQSTGWNCLENPDFFRKMD